MEFKKKKIVRQFALEGSPSGSAGRPRMLASCGDQEDQASLTTVRKRNTKRGLRSKTTIAERNTKRSIKRRIARRKHKKIFRLSKHTATTNNKLGFGLGTQHNYHKNQARQRATNCYSEHQGNKQTRGKRRNRPLDERKQHRHTSTTRNKITTQQKGNQKGIHMVFQ